MTLALGRLEENELPVVLGIVYQLVVLNHYSFCEPSYSLEV